MASIHITSSTRVVRDEKSDAIRSWYDVTAPLQTDKAFAPRAIARTVLEQSANLFNWVPALADLKDGELAQGLNTHSVRFTQEFKGIPVDASEVVVNMYSDSRVYSIYNNYHYDIPAELDPKKTKCATKQDD
jgi:Zn-dependent metalloprotease